MSQKKAEEKTDKVEEKVDVDTAQAEAQEPETDQANERREAFKKNLLAMLEGKPVLNLQLDDGVHQFVVLRDGNFHCTAQNDKHETFITDSVNFAYLLDMKDLTVHVRLAWVSPFGMQYTKIMPHASLYSEAAFEKATAFLFNHGLAMMLPQLAKFRLDLCALPPFGLTKLVKLVTKEEAEASAAVEQQAAQA